MSEITQYPHMQDQCSLFSIEPQQGPLPTTEILPLSKMLEISEQGMQGPSFSKKFFPSVLNQEEWPKPTIYLFKALFIFLTIPILPYIAYIYIEVKREQREIEHAKDLIQNPHKLKETIKQAYKWGLCCGKVAPCWNEIYQNRIAAMQIGPYQEKIDQLNLELQDELRGWTKALHRLCQQLPKEQHYDFFLRATEAVEEPYGGKQIEETISFVKQCLYSENAESATMLEQQGVPVAQGSKYLRPVLPSYQDATIPSSAGRTIILPPLSKIAKKVRRIFNEMEDQGTWAQQFLCLYGLNKEQIRETCYSDLATRCFLLFLSICLFPLVVCTSIIAYIQLRNLRPYLQCLKEGDKWVKENIHTLTDEIIKYIAIENTKIQKQIRENGPECTERSFDQPFCLANNDDELLQIYQNLKKQWKDSLPGFAPQCIRIVGDFASLFDAHSLPATDRVKLYITICQELYEYYIKLRLEHKKAFDSEIIAQLWCQSICSILKYILTGEEYEQLDLPQQMSSETGEENPSLSVEEIEQTHAQQTNDSSMENEATDDATLSKEKTVIPLSREEVEHIQQYVKSCTERSTSPLKKLPRPNGKLHVAYIANDSTNNSARET